MKDVIDIRALIIDMTITYNIIDHIIQYFDHLPIMKKKFSFSVCKCINLCARGTKL